MHEVTGYEFQGGSKKIILLEGTASRGGWDLAEYSAPGVIIGRIERSLALTSFEGEWKSPDGSSSFPLHLKRESRNVSSVPGEPLRLREVKAEAERQSEGFVEQAFQAAKAKEYAKAAFFLRLYRVTYKLGEYTEPWEEVFDAEAADAVLPLAAKVSRTQDALTVAALPYLEDRQGDIAATKRSYREQCLFSGDYPFTCLMYAAFSERIGDRSGMLEGYDYACPRLPFVCTRAFGSPETELIDDLSGGKTEKALKDMENPALNVNAKQGQALYEAVLHASAPLVRELLAKGADPNLRGDYLAIAIMNHYSEILQLLLDHGADPNRGAVLFYAVGQKNLQLTEQLLKMGADVNYDDNVGAGTVLMTAAEADNREMVELLLRYGADPTITAKFHDPPLVSAHDPEIKSLLEQAVRACKDGSRKCEEVH